MNITTSEAKGRVPITILHLQGDLDGQSYQELIKEARKLYDEGARDFILDLSSVAFMSSAGLVGLHIVSMLSRGEALPDVEQGWATMKTMGRSRGGKQEHVKLLGPRASVRNVINMVGFDQAFDIFDDQTAAVNSF